MLIGAMEISAASSTKAQGFPDRKKIILSAEDVLHSVTRITTDAVVGTLRQSISADLVTSKSHGLGLGLAISRSILKSHGGTIWCRQNPEGGAVFGFSLPAAERRVAWAS